MQRATSVVRLSTHWLYNKTGYCRHIPWRQKSCQNYSSAIFARRNHWDIGPFTPPPPALHTQQPEKSTGREGKKELYVFVCLSVRGAFVGFIFATGHQSRHQICAGKMLRCICTCLWAHLVVFQSRAEWAEFAAALPPFSTPWHCLLPNRRSTGHSLHG